jgi:hypothetical protein
MKTNGVLKKAIGMILIVIFSAISLMILLTLGYSLVKMGDDKNIVTIAFSLIFTLVLCYFPLQYGIRLWKSGRSDLWEIPSPSDRTITTSPVQITIQDYRSLVLILTFKNPFILYCGFLGLSFLFASLLNPGEINLIGGAIGVVFSSLPFFSVLQAKVNYRTNKNLKEIMVYEFNADNIIITGETFNSTLR